MCVVCVCGGVAGVCVVACVCVLCVYLSQQLNTPASTLPCLFFFSFLSLPPFVRDSSLLSSLFLLYLLFLYLPLRLRVVWWPLITSYVCHSYLPPPPHILPPSSISHLYLYTFHIFACMCNRAYRPCVRPSDLWSFIYTFLKNDWQCVCLSVCVGVCVCVRQSSQHWPSRLWRGCTPIGIPDMEANYCLCHLDSPCSRWALGCTGNT